MNKEKQIEKREIGYDLGSWYSRKAKFYLREANSLLQSFKYPECITSFNTSIEFSLKAICAFLNEKHDPQHDISKELIHLSKKYLSYKENFSRLALISSRCVGANDSFRLIINYGNQESSVPATKIITIKDIETIKEDAFEVAKFLRFIEIKQMLSSEREVGILDGIFNKENSKEIKCDIKKFTKFDIDDWEKGLLKCNNDDIKYN